LFLIKRKKLIQIQIFVKIFSFFISNQKLLR